MNIWDEKESLKQYFSFQCDFKKLSNLLRYFEINLIIFLIRLFIITQSMYKKSHFLIISKTITSIITVRVYTSYNCEFELRIILNKG